MSTDTLAVFREACTDIVVAVENGTPHDKKALNYAYNYARHGIEMATWQQSSVNDCRVQALYVLNNISTWRGDTAKSVRAALKAFTKETK